MLRFVNSDLHVGHRRAADLDAAADDVRRRAACRRRSACRPRRPSRWECAERACAVAIPAPICPAPSTPMRFTGRGLDVGIGHAPVAGQQVLHEEDADERGRDRRADDARRLAELDLDPFGKRPVDPVANRPQRGQWRGILALRRTADGPFRHAEGEVQLVVAEPQRLFLFAGASSSTRRFPGRTRSARRPSSTNRSRGPRRRPARTWRLRPAPIGSPEVIMLIACWTPTTRGNRCVPPQPGMMPTLTSGRPILVAGVRRGNPVIHGERDLGSAPHAIAVDQCDGRKRQATEAVKHLVTAVQRGQHFFLGGDRPRRPVSFRSAPAMNWPFLPLLSNRPLEDRSASPSSSTTVAQLRHHRLAETC